LAKDLEGLDPQSTIDVIVQFAHSAGDLEHERVNRRGGRLMAELPTVAGALYSMQAAVAADLAKDPDVVYISPDREVWATLEYANPTLSVPLAFQHGLAGSGIGVAVIDSGVLEVRDLQGDSISGSSVSRVVYNQSFVPKVTSAADQYGHGTHVAGILAGNGAASSGASSFKMFLGIAPSAQLINLRVLDSKGVGTDSSVISAIDRAIQLKGQYNIRVMNLSLGRPVYESYTKDPLCKAVERAWKAGIVVVVAAGNEGRNTSKGTDGYATITSPANDPLVITVGAMKHLNTLSRADDLIASYSSKGPTLLDHIVKPDLVAPGNHIISLVASKSVVASNSTSVNRVLYSYYQTTTSKSYSGDYYRLSGTSMAAAMATAASALMLQRDGSLTPETVKARLMKTATKSFPMYSAAVDPVTKIRYGSQYDIFTIGAGYLDVWAALNSLDSVPIGSTAASPTAVPNANRKTVRVINTDTTVWGKAAIWGAAEVWGSAAVWGSSVFVDGAAAVWGSSEVWGNAAVWGSSELEGSAAVWGSAAIWGTSNKPGGESLSQLINGEN
jgi:serine protease AprX